MLSGASIESFPCDEHIKSRLTPGMGFSIGAPSEDELSELLQLMARQRGINLSDRKVDFLSRRIGRDIASMEEYLEKVSHLSGILGKSIKFPLLSDAI